jgi:tetratricopeptide (TPR) repeat protein/O-antigen ligase
MQTRLSRFCSHVIEAGWLTAVVVVPLFFNVYSSRVFEPDKLTLLRSIALVMIAAWAIRTLEEGRAGTSAADRSPASLWARIRSTPLVLPTLLLIGIYLISTLVSVNSRASLWGSYQRLQGTYTTLAYLVIFFLILRDLRRPSQIRRLVTTAVIVSLPISIYGLIQHYGLDPLPWGGDVSYRVAANMGNAIFVAAYLVMVLPLTLSRVVESVSAILRAEETVWRDVILATSYLFILAVQIICILFSKSRGPWMGLMAGLFFFVLLLALVRRWRIVTYASIAAALLGGLFLVLLNLPGTPLEPFRTLPYVGRLGRVFETDVGTGKVRVLIWQGAVQLASPHAPIVYPSGQVDILNPIRPLIGYGPESMYVAYNRFYPPDLAHYEARNASPDRSHNETFDALVMTGVVGFLVYMLLFAAVFYYGLRWLGAIATPRQRLLFIGLWLGGGVAGATFFGLWQGAHFIGVGLPFGIALGLIGYLIVRAVLMRQGRVSLRGPHQLLLIGLISALIAHFVEIHFGIAIAATRTYFWTYAALMVVIGHHLSAPRPPAEQMAPGEPSSPGRRRRRRTAIREARKDDPQGRRWGGDLLVAALLMSLILVTMGFDYVTAQFDLSAGQRSILWLFALTWLVGSAVALGEWGRGKVESWGTAIAVYAMVSVGVFLLFLVTHDYQIRLQSAPTTLKGVLDIANRIAGILPHYYLYLLALLLAMGAAMFKGRRLPELKWRRANWWLYPLLMMVTFFVVYATNLQVVMADIIYKQAQPYDQKQQWAVSIPLYRRALKLVPHEDFYYLFLGRALLENAKDTSPDQPGVASELSLRDLMTMDPERMAQMSRQELLEASRLVLQQAQTVNPLNTDHSANLGRLHRTWAEMVTAPAERDAMLSQAEAYYDQATSLSPHNAQLWNEWGLVHIVQGDSEKALEKYERSLSLDQEYEQTYALVGDLYMSQQKWEQSAESYRRVVELRPNLLQAHATLGYIYAQQGKTERAIEENLFVAERSPKDYNSRKNLALLYRQVGDTEQALVQARRAWELAPEDQKSGVAGLISQLGGHVEAPQEAAASLQDHLDEGRQYLEEERWAEAAQAYDRALEMDPNSVQAHSAMGFIYAKQGRLEEAVQENLAVAQLAPEDFNSHKNLALLYRDLGQLDQALDEAILARELAPQDQKPAVEEFIAQLEQQARTQ